MMLRQYYSALALCCMMVCALETPAQQVKSEQRVYKVMVDTTDAGTYTQTITTYGEGTTDLVGKSDVKFKVLGMTYQQAYRGQERWKENHLIHLSSASNDNGTPHTLQVDLDKGQLKVKEGGKERFARADAWTTSYWFLLPKDRRDKPFALIDADSGIEYQVTLQNLGKEVQIVDGQRMTCTHYKVVGNVPSPVDLWFDENDRLVRRESQRRGKKITLSLMSATVR